MRLEGKVAIISGGARGMGAEEARLFAREGAKVVIGDVLDEAGRQVEAEINESGGECVFVRLDVTSEEAWAEAVAAAVSRFGKLDVVVNNAGVVARGVLEDTSVEEWDRGGLGSRPVRRHQQGRRLFGPWNGPVAIAQTLSSSRHQRAPGNPAPGQSSTGKRP